MQVDVSFAKRDSVCDDCGQPLTISMLMVRSTDTLRAYVRHFACFRQWALLQYMLAVDSPSLEYQVQIRANLILLPSEVSDGRYVDALSGKQYELQTTEEWKEIPRT